MSEVKPGDMVLFTDWRGESPLRVVEVQVTSVNDDGTVNFPLGFPSPAKETKAKPGSKAAAGKWSPKV